MAKKRIILDLSDEQKENILLLKKECNITSYAELVRMAVGLLKLTVKYKKEGYDLHFVKDNKKVDVALPIFGL